MKSSRLRKIDGLLDQQQALRRKREGDVDEFDDSSTAMAEANKYELKNTYILTNKTLDSLTMMAFMVLVCPVLYMILHYTIIHFVGTDSSTVNINEADARVFCIIIVSVTVFHALHELVRFSSSHLSWKFVTGLSFAIHFMCSFCYCMIEYDLSPVVSTVSGRGYYIMRDCMWLFTTPLMIILVSNTIVLPLATVLRLVVWDEVMIVSGLVTNFLPAPYCYITLALSVMFFLFFNYSLYCLHRVAQEEYPLAMQISFVWIHITWCAFPIVWSLGFFDFIDEGMEHTLFALCDITAKLGFTLILGSSNSEFQALLQDVRVARVAQRAAENDVARKSKFLRYLFHEIRVPLTSLILGVDSLKNLLPEDLDSVLACNTLTHSDASDSTCKTSRRDGLVSYSQSGGQIKTLVDMMATSTGHMSRILNDTLSLEKMREGKLSLVEESFHVRDLIDDALFMLGPSIEDKHLNVVKIEQTNLPRMVGDTCRIKQVIANFMTNAIKFSSEYNTITVTAQVVPGGYTHPRMFLPVFSPPVSNRRLGSSSISSSGSSSGEQKRTCNLCVTIRDNGVGISDENQKRLFQPFVQINPHELQQGEGSGLGLSICKRIVEMYNGDVGVYSELSVGSEFYFIIPLEITETEDPQPLSILPSTSSSVGERKTDSGPFPLDVLLKGHGGNISAKVKGAAAGSSSSSSPTSPPQRKRKKKRTTKKNRRRLSGKASSKNSGDSLAAKLKGVQVMVCDDIGSIRKLLSMSLRRNGMIVHEAKDGNECVEFFCQNSLDRGVKGSENNGTLESEGYDDTVGVTTRNMRQRKRQQRSLIHTPANTVSNADDGGGGIAQQAREVRLLFIDMEMPVMNGPEAIRLLRDGGLRIPIIGLTGNVLDMDQHAFLDAGANMVLNKPVQPDTLLQLILKHVEEDE